MPALQYGLNIPKKPTSLANRPPPAKRKTIFDDDSGPEDGPDDDNNTKAITIIGDLQPTQSSPEPSNTSNTRSNKLSDNAPFKEPGAGAPRISQYGDLSTNRTSTFHTSTAQSLDPTIYDYDSVYDALRQKPTAQSSGPTGPRYMSNLLAAAEVRKRDQLRAKEKMLTKERETEGDEFADKEKFVTGAYKAQQEEVRRMEAEEARREREEFEKRKEGGGMVGLYKGMLERDEKRHEQVVKAVEEGKGKAPGEEPIDGKQAKSEGELAKEKGVAVNEDGVVVDKRELLSAGLNVPTKPKAAAAHGGDSARNVAPPGGLAGLQGKGGAKQAMRGRQTRMLEAQLEEASKRAADNEDVQREALERAAKSRKTEVDITSAKERYLQRKREAVAAAAAAKSEEGDLH